MHNDTVNMNFKPLYQCIHIYEALDRKSELQRSYQEDRKVGSFLKTFEDSLRAQQLKY